MSCKGKEHVQGRERWEKFCPAFLRQVTSPPTPWAALHPLRLWLRSLSVSAPCHSRFAPVTMPYHDHLLVAVLLIPYHTITHPAPRRGRFAPISYAIPSLTQGYPTLPPTEVGRCSDRARWGTFGTHPSVIQPPMIDAGARVWAGWENELTISGLCEGFMQGCISRQ